jgi:hypothetical protein
MDTERVVARLSQAVIDDCCRVVRRAIVETDDMSGCLLVDVSKHTRLSRNAKGYVQIKTCTPGKPNEKVQLHQLMIWSQPPPLQQQLVRDGVDQSWFACWTGS